MAVFGDILIDDGRADPFFQISAQGPAYTVEGPGTDGHVARNATNNNLYTVTITLKGTSQHNQELSALHIVDRQAFNGAGVAPLLIKDVTGATLIATDRAWITQMAEQSLGVNKPDVAWEFTAYIEPGGFILGGN